MPTAIEWAHLAGFIDGDGHFRMRAVNNRRSRLYPMLTVTQKDRRILDTLHKRFAVGHVRVFAPSGKSKCHVWCVSKGDDVRYVAQRVLPYLLHPPRIEQANEVLDHD